MTHEKQRQYLIRALLAESSRYRNIQIPDDVREQKNLLRALMNIRPPLPVGEAFLNVQDAYLSAERDRMGTVDAESLPGIGADERIVLWQGDITTLKADAIVNAANAQLRGCFCPLHSCIDNIIHSKSGIQLRLACDALMRRQGHDEPNGQAKITPAYNLPCRYVLHTVGPVVCGRVTQHGLSSIAFCCISTGEFHFPNQEAAEIAICTVKEFLQTPSSIQKVIFNVFKKIDKEIYQNLLRKDSRAETGSLHSGRCGGGCRSRAVRRSGI